MSKAVVYTTRQSLFRADEEATDVAVADGAAEILEFVGCKGDAPAVRAWILAPRLAMRLLLALWLSCRPGLSAPPPFALLPQPLLSPSPVLLPTASVLVRAAELTPTDLSSLSLAAATKFAAAPTVVVPDSSSPSTGTLAAVLEVRRVSGSKISLTSSSKLLSVRLLGLHRVSFSPLPPSPRSPATASAALLQPLEARPELTTRSPASDLRALSSSLNRLCRLHETRRALYLSLLPLLPSPPPSSLNVRNVFSPLRAVLSLAESRLRPFRLPYHFSDELSSLLLASFAALDNVADAATPAEVREGAGAETALGRMGVAERVCERHIEELREGVRRAEEARRDFCAGCLEAESCPCPKALRRKRARRG
jgi:hypothetical protein